MKSKNKEKKAVDKKIKAVDLRVIAGVCIAVLILAITLVIVVKNKNNVPEKNDQGKTPSEDKEEVKGDDSTIEEDYGFTKEDAKKVVMERFQSDNYEATSVTIREDNMYIVVVTNTDNGSTYTYVVDPNTGEARLEME